MSDAVSLLDSSLRVATPLLFATMGGVLSERAGVINLGLESYLLAGAFGTAAGAIATGSLLLGVGIGVVASFAVAAVHGLICTRTRADHVVVGVALNLLVDAATIAALVSLYRQKGATPPFEGDVVARLNESLVAVPFIGRHSPLTILAVLAIPAVAFFLRRTKPGLRVRAVGENPECAESLGVSAVRVRLWAVMAAGVVTGLGGAYLALDANGFSRHMSSERGYLALACVVIGKWRPVWAAAAAFGFAVLTAVSNRLELTLDVPDQLTAMLPYLVTLVVLSGVVGRAHPPAALGKPLG